MSNRNCSVFGCMNTPKNTSNIVPKVRFFSFPGYSWEEERKQIWIRFTQRICVNGKPWLPNRNSFICSQHFVGNIKSQNPHSPSFNPTLRPATKEGRYQRFMKRRSTFDIQEGTSTSTANLYLKITTNEIGNREQVRTRKKSTNDTRQCPAVSPIDKNGDENSASRVLEPKNTQCNENRNMMNALAEDLQTVVQDLWKGSVSVSLGKMPGENVWTIQGPKKSITVKVHYRNDGDRLPDKFTSSDDVSIKQELEDSTMFDLTNRSFELPSVSTRVAGTVEPNTIDSTCRRSNVEPALIKRELGDLTMFDITNSSFELPGISTHVAETVKLNTIDSTCSQRFVTQPTIRRQMPREASLPMSNFVHVKRLESSTNDEFILPDLGDDRHIPVNISLDRIKSEPCDDEMTVNAEGRNLCDDADSWHRSVITQ